MNERNQNDGLFVRRKLYSSKRHMPFYEIFMNFIKFYSVIFIIRLFLHPFVIRMDQQQELTIVGNKVNLLYNLSAIVKQCQGSNSNLLEQMRFALPMITIQTCTKYF